MAEARTPLRPGHQLGRHGSQPRRHLDLRCAFRAANGRLGGGFVMLSSLYFNLFLGFATAWLLTSFVTIGYSVL
jgi:hypothetical protein